MEPLAFARIRPQPAEAASAVVPVALTMNAPAVPTPTLAALFEAEESALLRFALGLTGRRAVAEELVQEAFLRLHQVWGQIENPRAWLFQSVRNLALNHQRDHRRESPLPSPADGTGLENAPDPAGPAPAELGRMEAVGLVRMLLAEMPAEDRRLVLLKYATELKYQEISEQTGLSVGHVGYKLHHLLKGLADALRRAGIEGSEG
jgi:RNA polymerase sigma-70 factor (ECF subfamily)